MLPGFDFPRFCTISVVVDDYEVRYSQGSMFPEMSMFARFNVLEVQCSQSQIFSRFEVPRIHCSQVRVRIRGQGTSSPGNIEPREHWTSGASNPGNIGIAPFLSQSRELLFGQLPDQREAVSGTVFYVHLQYIVRPVHKGESRSLIKPLGNGTLYDLRLFVISWVYCFGPGMIQQQSCCMQNIKIKSILCDFRYHNSVYIITTCILSPLSLSPALTSSLVPTLPRSIYILQQVVSYDTAKLALELSQQRIYVKMLTQILQLQNR